MSVISRDTTPAVFNRTPAGILSPRYSLVETDTVIDALAPLGWIPQSYQNMRRNKAGLASGRDPATVKHLVRLQMSAENRAPDRYGDIPQIVLVNSHDGSSPWLFLVGLHVFVCSNGLISNRGGWTIRLKHMGLEMARVLSAITGLASKFPELLDTRDRYAGLMLTDDQANDFAYAAGRLRWPEPIIFNPSDLLRVHYDAQRSNSLWNIFNRVQAALTGKGITTTDPNRPKIPTRRSRAINAIGETVSTNQGLWELLDQFGNALSPSPVLV